ncbi:MAG: flagellar motor protein MotB [Candidatus Auribacterota bacterium]|jgi:chemotaxis protein MotB|nr:flagellar motor protein MotB [Candidatus Auribacterota bacterium]
MAKKQKIPEPPKGAPLWMTTYGDMMTLLLCFFVLLLSFSSIAQEEFNKAIGSLQGYLGILVSHNVAVVDKKFINTEMVRNNNPSNMKKEAEQDKEKPESYIISLAEEVEKTAQKKGIGGSVEVIQFLNSIRVRIPVSIAFKQGKMTLSEESKEVLKKIARLTKNLPYSIDVEGHTDNVPIYSEKYNSNWDLSSARAIQVVEYLVDLGVSRDKLRAVGCSEYKPIAGNDTEEGKEKNRRVELIITAYDPEQLKALK